ncbi:DUF302 domain-containing protein [Chitinibacter sp. GC72]|uniref:DUF302 domain-containing protein n=1 Tax=Chitinibacter sp. GC72 TaxID=1526917 RepID=UPI0012FBD8C5|nr:DUF302 domain-containing protein [Chitinibacter sp. GC72]
MCEEPNAFGIDKIASAYDFSETIARLSSAIQSKGATIFAQIDHQAQAKQQQLELAPTQLLIFGHPKIGTALINSASSTGLDLPLKALVSQDCHGQVWVYLNQPDFLQLRHGFDDELLTPLRGLHSLLSHSIH